jgi:hypothetical protein
MKFLVKILVVQILLLVACASDSEPTKVDDGPVPVKETAYAFPGVEGFGKTVTGGRGGKVILVTNLNDSGTGSLRAAIQQAGARYVLFTVSGTIELQSQLTISNGNITIAGQTAPGDGICLKNHPVVINADNVIVRFMRFRMGDEGAEEADALGGRYRKNVVIDHCSMSWSTDECVSFYGNENFTMQWCILSESLKNSVHEKGAHGYGGIWGGKNASFHHNLIAHHDSRNPRFDHPGVYNTVNTTEQWRGTVDFRNNVIYNWGNDATYGGELGTFNLVANYYIPGPASSNSRRILNAYKQATTTATEYGFGDFYVAGNFLDGAADITMDNWIGVQAKSGTEADKIAMKLTTALPAGDFTSAHTAQQAFEKVKLYAGASLTRDAVDARIVSNVTNKTFLAAGSRGSTNGIIDSQTDVGGWPVLNSLPALIDTDLDGMPDAWEVDMKLDPAKANANSHDLSTGYDNIEVYINSVVKTITEQQVK